MAEVSSPMVLRERNATPEEEGKKVLVSAEKKATPEPTHPILAPSPVRCRKLEPSLQAWVASQPTPAATPNVAPSEAMTMASRGRERERRTSRECYRPHDWSASLREETESKQFWGKEFQPTVPLGPRLRTEERSRSRSCSRECTPQCTPTRRSQSRSMTPGRGMPAKEQVAVEQYLSRMSLARLDSPMQKFAFGSSIERGVAPSPARSNSSRGSDLSRDSRLSHLLRPRSLSKDLLSTEDRECLQAAEERRALRKQLRRNRRKYKEALLGGSVTERCTERMLTTPMAPELMTTYRGSRMRSSSWHGADHSHSLRTEGSDSRVFLKKHPNPREQAAIERHLEQRFAAVAPLKAPTWHRELPSPAPATATPVRKSGKKVMIPENVDVDEWIKAGESTEERAERARAVALAKRDSEWEQQRSKLCVFRPSTGKAPATSPKKDDAEDQNENAEIEASAVEGKLSKEDLPDSATPWCE
ncbi:Carbonic anhydrase 2 [Durusdinium trenchii]|uniref:Carbonic anhydrase 2 n=1 Tax=Durusdinium trenchii TaxID=1381693 RepID=A0ABP0PEZ9_9DINO